MDEWAIHARLDMGSEHPAQGEEEHVDAQEKQLTRRKFLTWFSRGSLAAAAAVVAGQIIRFLSFQPSGGKTAVVPAGRPEAYPADTRTYVPQAQAYVGHDSQGLYALDAVCPHLGCLVEQTEEGGFVCPCHGSDFDADGVVQTGPATKSLRYLRLSLDDGGQLVIDRSQPVEASTRLDV